MICTTETSDAAPYTALDGPHNLRRLRKLRPLPWLSLLYRESDFASHYIGQSFTQRGKEILQVTVAVDVTWQTYSRCVVVFVSEGDRRARAQSAFAEFALNLHDSENGCQSTHRLLVSLYLKDIFIDYFKGIRQYD